MSSALWYLSSPQSDGKLAAVLRGAYASGHAQKSVFSVSVLLP